MTALEVGWIAAVVAGAAILEWGAAEALARVARATLWTALGAALVAFVVLLSVRPPSLALGNVVGLAVAAVGGAALGRMIDGRPAVIAFALAMSIADILSVYLGLAGDLAASPERGPGSLLAWLTLAVPFDGEIVFMVGLGDLLVLAFFFTVLSRIGVPPVARATVPSAGLVGALAFGLAVPGPSPGLPFIAAAVVTYLLVRKPRPGGPP